MAIALQAVYNQLTSLDSQIRHIALTPVADLNVEIGDGNWQNCLYAVMTKVVAAHHGNNIRRVNGAKAALLLRLPLDTMKFCDWDRATARQRLQLRQAIKAFLDKEAKKALIQEIEAMGDSVAVAKRSPRREKVLVG